MASARLVLFLACAALAHAGLALGAAAQREVFLHLDAEPTQAQAAAGSILVLTGVLVAIGVAVGSALLSQRPWRNRTAAAALLGAASYLLVQLVQTAWPNYSAVLEERKADLANTLIVANQAAVASLATPVFSLLWLALAAAGLALARLRGPDGLGPTTIPALRRLHLGLLLVALPFLAIHAAGTIRVLVSLPSGRADLVGALILLPVATLALTGLAITESLKAWHLAQTTRDPRLRPVAREAWTILGRASLVLAAIGAAVAIAGSLLPTIAVNDLEQGRTLRATLRGHTQFTLFALLPMIPLLRIQGRAQSLLDRPSQIAAPAAPVATLLGIAAIVAAAATVTLLASGTTWAWMVALTAASAIGLRSAPRQTGALLLLLLALAVWFHGNTVIATYDGRTNVDLRYAQGSGILALWRLLAVVAGAAAATRLAYGLAPHLRPARAWTFAVSIGLCAGILALLELSLHAWVAPGQAGTSVAVGSFPASQTGLARILLECTAAAASLGGALLLARLWRPDWFGRAPAQPRPASQRQATPAQHSPT